MNPISQNTTKPRSTKETLELLKELKAQLKK